MEVSTIEHSDAAQAVSPNDPGRLASEHRRSILSLRWLVIILASYLTLFTYIATPAFPAVFAFTVLFAATNVGITFIPAVQFEQKRTHHIIAVVDALFVTVIFYLLSGAGTYLYLGFAVIFVLALVWRELKLVLVSVLIVSLLYATFSYFRVAQFGLDISIEKFLILSLFFVVSMYYVFLSDQLRRDAAMSHAAVEERLHAEVMVEITRALSSTLKTQEILLTIVNRVRELLGARECSIVEVDAKTGRARIMAQSSNAAAGNVEVELSAFPELSEAYSSRRMLHRRQPSHDAIAVPMVAQNRVLGLIHVVGPNTVVLSDANVRFFEVMAGAAANALRNAQLFEEVEQRARTDFLTGLPNHRYFQTTLSAELGRAQRHSHPLSLLIVDLDYLKVINDRHGHPSGDMVIRTVGETIRSSCREFDFAARYGGEEFTVILPETPLAGAIQVADRIRENIARTNFRAIGNITASVGVANYPVNAMSREDLIRIADQALYIAKKGGRDRVAYFTYQVMTR
jgi:diguanylate cyclase (GGDEF)-like protein